MSDKFSKLTEEELLLIKETELFLEEVHQDVEVQNTKVPSELYEGIWEEIHAYEAMEAREKLCDEDKELLRLGRMYKKKHRARKYVVLAAAVIAMLALGITSVGGPEKIFETVSWVLGGRKQINVDSDNENVVRPDDLAEEEIYEEIEEKFGFLPVKLDYLPEGVGLVEAQVSEEIQNIYILYGTHDEIKISFQISPHYRESSWGKDIEDEVLEEFEITVSDVVVHLQKYLVNNGTERWLIRFEYKNISYSMLIMNLEQKEVEKIVQNLYFF